MNAIVFMLIAGYGQLDGYQLFTRSQDSKPRQAYNKYLKALREAAMAEAWEAAGSGQTEASVCIDETKTEGRGGRSSERVRSDLGRIFLRISGISFRPESTSDSCFTLDWSQT